MVVSLPKGSGGGRPAKPKGQKRNRVKPTKTDTVVASDAKVSDVPEPTVDLKMFGRAQEVWDRMWATPIATLWSDQDVAALTRLVIMQSDVEMFSDKGALSEMRQMEDRFLMNPYSRAQQRIKFLDESSGEEDPGSVSDIGAWRDRISGTS